MNHFKLLLFLVVVQVGFGQDILFEHYTDADGLSQNSVRHILQDKNGLLWLGTFSGLNGFDGYEFNSHTATSAIVNKLANYDITALELDKETDHLWVGTRNGLFLFNAKTHTITPFLPNSAPNSILDEEIRSIHIDRFKQVWVGTKNKGLFIYNSDENHFTKVGLPNFNYVKDIFEDTSGAIWIGSYGTAGVAKITLSANGEIVVVKSYNLEITGKTERNPYINFIYEDHKNDIFVGSRKGLYKLNREADNFVDLVITDTGVKEKLGPYFNAVTRTPNGKYWLGTLGGLLELDALEDVAKGKFKWYYSQLANSESLIDNMVTALFVDASGVLWVGTENGLDKYDPFKNQFKLNKDISRNIDNQIPIIRGFSKTIDDKILVATRHNGIYVLKDNHYELLFKTNEDIASIYSTNGTQFYLGLWNGNILIYNYETNTQKVVDIGFEKAAILAFENLDNNKIVIGSHGEGAVIFNTKTLQAENKDEKIVVNAYVNQIAVDSLQQIWFATQEGVVRYNHVTKQSKIFSSTEGDSATLSHENVSDIKIDSDGNIWAATRKGLDYFNVKQNKFMPLFSPSELHGSWVTHITPDIHGNLWLNLNNNRVAHYFPANKRLKVYYVNTGNRLEIFSLSGFYYADDAHMYLGGKNGIISFTPNALLDNSRSPAPIITNVRIQNTEIGVGEVLNNQKILEQDLNVVKTLTLANVNKNFSFTFSSPSFVNERFNKYSYILEGFDTKWNTVDVKQRTVQYTNLFFGDYTFKVKAMNSHGIWSETATYKIKILPPFWLTYKAALMCLGILTILGFFIRKQLMARRTLKNAVLMEKIRRERDEKLNNEKLLFFTNISHELRTPLTLILGPAEQLMTQARETSNNFQLNKSGLIYQNAQRLLNLVNQVLDFRRAQSGELSLKVTETDILVHTKNTFRTFQELADDKRIHFNINCEADVIFGFIDNDKYDKILYNLLSNALKFTGKYGHVDLYVSERIVDKQKRLIVEVSDDGIGIPEESKAKIFQRFYQAANSKENNTGSGIGLSLVKALIELHKGKITVESESNKGSMFTIDIPIDEKAYTKAEIFEIEKPKMAIKPQLNAPIQPVNNELLKERILIIEDNVELRQYVAAYLMDYYMVFQAANGEDGLKVCRRIKPTLCVVDVMMPIVNGLQFCNSLKQDDSISHIPIILLTALSDNDDKINGYSAGADGYLVKPFIPSLLKSRIENIIKSRQILKSRFSSDTDSEVNTLIHSPVDAEFMEKLTVLIKNNLAASTLNTSFLCAELGMSSSKLYRKIKEITDLSPNEFVRTFRLKKGAEYLKIGTHNVSEVSSMVGFNDPLYFSRCFKKQFGFPPSKLQPHSL